MMGVANKPFMLNVIMQSIVVCVFIMSDQIFEYCIGGARNIPISIVKWVGFQFWV